MALAMADRAPNVSLSRRFSSLESQIATAGWPAMRASCRRKDRVALRRGQLMVRCKANERTPPTANASLPVKLAWYFSEAFGNVASVFRRPPQIDDASNEEEASFEGAVNRQVAAEAIRKDYEKSYFVTGNMTTGIYRTDCEFADPFVSFKGLKRFKQNVSNLGSFMEKSTLKIADWQENEDSIKVRWRFMCVLALPWRPIIAATGSTEYFFDNESGKICKHVESWDISPADGVRQLFKRSKLAK